MAVLLRIGHFQKSRYAFSPMVENRLPFFSEKIFFHEIKKIIEVCLGAFQKAPKQVPTPKIRGDRSKKPKGEQ